MATQSRRCERTPGPWHVTATVHADRRNIFAPDFHVGTLVSGSRRKLDVFEANTDFIVRACNSHCELLDALEVMAAFAEKTIAVAKLTDTNGIVAASRAIIAKARGETL